MSRQTGSREPMGTRSSCKSVGNGADLRIGNEDGSMDVAKICTDACYPRFQLLPQQFFLSLSSCWPPCVTMLRMPARPLKVGLCLEVCLGACQSISSRMTSFRMFSSQFTGTCSALPSSMKWEEQVPSLMCQRTSRPHQPRSASVRSTWTSSL